MTSGSSGVEDSWGPQEWGRQVPKGNSCLLGIAEKPPWEASLGRTQPVIHCLPGSISQPERMPPAFLSFPARHGFAFTG